MEYSNRLAFLLCLHHTLHPGHTHLMMLHTMVVRVLQQNIPNLLSQADRFQASSPHRPQTPDDDHYLSQVLELLQSSDFTNLGLSFLNCANRFPAPESAPENDQDHVQQVHSPFLQAPHGSRDSTRL
jgi:hypothetical protein